MAMLCAVALIIFVVEAQIPALVPIPGIKLGLSNIITVFAVFTLGSWEAAMILAVRIFLGAVFAGNFSTILYSAAGGALAILTTIGLKKLLKEAQLWVAGCLGAIAHSIGQMAMAIAITQTPGLAIYLPIMIGCSIVCKNTSTTCSQRGTCVTIVIISPSKATSAKMNTSNRIPRPIIKTFHQATAIKKIKAPTSWA